MSEAARGALRVPKASAVLFSARGTESEARGRGWRGWSRRRLEPLKRSASAPTAAVAAAQPAECASLRRGAGRAWARACRPAARRRACVRACACAPQPALSWFSLFSRLLPRRGDVGRFGFDSRQEKQGGGAEREEVRKWNKEGVEYVSYGTSQSRETKGGQGRE